MNKNEILKQIKLLALEDAKKRSDKRFLATMGFLVGKGFLKTNLDIPLMPNKRLKIEDVVWAGENLEPRILEVLPAAALRLAKHFDLDVKKHPHLAKAVEQLQNQNPNGDDFMGIPYKKFKVWAELKLKDGRVKPLSKKKVLKTYRLAPDVALEIKRRAKQWNCAESDVLARMLASKTSTLD